MKKKGISAIVAMVLIVLVSVVGVAIVWGVVIPMINDDMGLNTYGSGLDIVTDGGYTYCDSSNGILSVQVKRSAEEDGMTGLIFMVIMNGDSVSYSNNEGGTPWVLPKIGTTKVYKLNISQFILGSCDAVASVSVIPVYGNKQGRPGIIDKVMIGNSPDGDTGSGNPDDGFGGGVCSETNGGVEICGNGVDEDCDGDLDWLDSEWG